MATPNSTNFFWDRLVPTLYSVGAAIVVTGAMFKINHLAGGTEMLFLGLGTEAIIFLLYAAQSYLFPPSSATDYAWERVYPELSQDYKGEARKPTP